MFTGRKHESVRNQAALTSDKRVTEVEVWSDSPSRFTVKRFGAKEMKTAAGYAPE